MADRICSVDECGLPVHCGGMCAKHYARQVRHGDTEGGGRRLPWPESLLQRMEPQANGCIYFTGYIRPDGYGNMARNGTQIRSHRAAYEHFVGPIPEGMEVDHLCRHRQCCNPDHLEVVTHAENMARGRWATATHCIHGHEFDEENTYRTAEGKRSCRKCAAASWERRKQRKEEGA